MLAGALLRQRKTAQIAENKFVIGDAGHIRG